jgi:hypothetical protein
MTQSTAKARFTCPLQALPRAFVVAWKCAGLRVLVIPAKAGIHSLLLVLSLSLPVAAHEVDPDSGLVVAPGYEQVRAQCTVCHSARLVTQNRASREGWQQMIRWMQESQGLWPLGDAEPLILDYLEQNYGPRPRGRRAPLVVSFDE